MKQWAYCRRINYYHARMPGIGRATYKMNEALRAQDVMERLELRRGLAKYGLEGGRREFGRWYSDGEVGLTGKVDLLIESRGEASIVDFKLTSGQVGENHRLQLTGYALLVENEKRLAAT